MTVTTLFSSTADDAIYSRGNSYASAQDGGDDTFTTFSALGVTIAGFVGQSFDGSRSICTEAFFDFDIAAGIGASQTISDAVLSLYGETGTYGNQSTTDFTLEAYEFDWGTTVVTTEDWQDDTELASLNSSPGLAASKDTSGWSTSAYNDFTNSGTVLLDAATTAYDGSVELRLVVASSRHRGDNAPSGAEYVGVAMADASGTTNDPKLVITHDSSSTPVDADAVQTLAIGAQAGVGDMRPTAAMAQTLAVTAQAGAGVQRFIAAGVQTLAAVAQAAVGVMQPSAAVVQTLAIAGQAAMSAVPAVLRRGGRQLLVTINRFHLRG